MHGRADKERMDIHEELNSIFVIAFRLQFLHVFPTISTVQIDQRGSQAVFIEIIAARTILLAGARASRSPWRQPAEC